MRSGSVQDSEWRRTRTSDAVERDHGYPPGAPCWVDTLQPDPNAALEFYGRLLGWEFTQPSPMPSDLPGQYFAA